ncbi:hypothetical protein [Sinorhizobium meliloti]|nr:hypothetical protein [Sinorhizobium meliloti]AEG53595.1 hypothetical protein Sinme_1868 [Sinorhizobium meliloti AK83]WQO40235.1 hypothetical protein U8C34_26625 [Sinorhizobium meliloti]WQO80654.1 hypothetical protein U8C44_26610 [Sinorhizobium meliloti]SEJ73481.1 hypothetical protein SAMN04244575_05950 [Sinorhizobium meliloti]
MPQPLALPIGHDAATRHQRASAVRRGVPAGAIRKVKIIREMRQ